MTHRALLIPFGVLLVVACAGPASDPAANSAANHGTGSAHGDQAVRTTAQPSVTFETTTANRDIARTAGKPVLLRGQGIVYPPELDAAHYGNGWVVVSIAVMTNGSVGDIRVITHSAPAFDQAAITAIRTWVFEPMDAPQTFTHRVFVQAPQQADHYQPTSEER